MINCLVLQLFKCIDLEEQKKISFLRKMHTDFSLGHSLDDW